jgi:RNA polymerase sigma-70 factor (ECF subfamily)
VVSDDEEFLALLARVRASDERAAEELVRRYEPLIRFEVRLRLTDPRVCRLFDSIDVCQSVLSSFFVRAAAGQYDLEKPQQLVALLVKMARNKVATLARREQARDADWHRDATTDLSALEGGFEPSQRVAASDLLAEVQRRLSSEEAAIAALRGRGETWIEIAAALGGTAEARRKQLTRALNRVTEELGIDEVDDG